MWKRGTLNLFERDYPASTGLKKHHSSSLPNPKRKETAAAVRDIRNTKDSMSAMFKANTLDTKTQGTGGIAKKALDSQILKPHRNPTPLTRKIRKVVKFVSRGKF